MTNQEADNVRNSSLAIEATQKQSCEDEDIAKAFQLGLAFGLDEKYNEMDKTLQQQPKIKVLDRNEVIRKLTAVDIYQASAWVTLIKDLEYLELKICEVEE